MSWSWSGGGQGGWEGRGGGGQSHGLEVPRNVKVGIRESLNTALVLGELF